MPQEGRCPGQMDNVVTFPGLRGENTWRQSPVWTEECGIWYVEAGEQGE